MNTDPAQEIATGTVTVTKGGMTFTRPIVIANYTGTVTLSGLQVGRWNILVQLFDSEGYEIYTGEAQAVVNKNQTTTARIRVGHNTGSLDIIVDVPSAYPPSGMMLNVSGDDLASLMSPRCGEMSMPAEIIAGTPTFGLARFDNGFANAQVGYWLDTSVTGQGAFDFWFGWDGSSPAVVKAGSVEFTIMNYGPYPGILLRIPCQQGTFVYQAYSLPLVVGSAHHVAVSVDSATAGIVRVFLDGVEVGLTLSSNPGGTANIILSAPILVGSESSACPIDELRVWNYAKTDFSDRDTLY
jgi:hypothetical protein